MDQKLISGYNVLLPLFMIKTKSKLPSEVFLFIKPAKILSLPTKNSRFEGEP
jgi:hypothetical protein